MSDKMISIAFTNGGLIPKSIAKAKDNKDKSVAPHTPVKVPYDYGKSLVADRLAYEWDKDAEKAAEARNAQSPDAGAVVEKASSDAQEIVAEAQTTADALVETATASANAVIEKANTDAETIVAAAQAAADEVAKASEANTAVMITAAEAKAAEILHRAELTGQVTVTQADLLAATPENMMAAQKAFDDANKALADLGKA